MAAINDSGEPSLNVHLTKYDSAHGHFPDEEKVEGNAMAVCGDSIRIFSERNPSDLPSMKSPMFIFR